MSSEISEEQDPLVDQTIVLLRIYDALIANLMVATMKEDDPRRAEIAEKLYDLHAHGGTGSPDLFLDINHVMMGSKHEGK